MSHCEENRIFSPLQYGFMKSRSCILQLLKITDEWTKFIDNDQLVDVSFLDFRKAYNSVPYKCLLHKL